MHSRTLTLAALSAYAFADDIPSCGAGLDLCPSEYPCCGSDGVCANGYACMGGCDPRYSNTPGSCMPMPVCKSQNYTLTDSSAFLNSTSYMGDASANDFIYTGEIKNSDDGIQAIMTENNTATTIILNHYVWYGKVTMKMKCAAGAGVISDFILLSDVKDEIDYEMVGSSTTDAQTNYYWQGVLNYSNQVQASLSDDSENWHTYEVDWKEDSITWSIDGNSVRTLEKADTYNSTLGSYSFPQTPSRVQFGLWAAGDSIYQGTSQWAGGSVDWSNAPFTVEFGYLNVECYDAPSGTNSTGSKAYRYTNDAALSSNIEITDDSTVLESADGDGTNPCGSECSSSSSSSGSSSAGATLGGSAASKSSSQSASATLSGSESKSSSSSDATLSGSESSSASSSSSGSGSGSSSASGSAGSSGSASKTASATASSSAAGSDSSSSSSAASNAAVVAGIAAFAPLAFLL